MSIPPRVILPHPVLYYDKDTSTRRWKFDTEPIIREYGALVWVAEEPAIMLSVAAARDEVTRSLLRLNFDVDTDYFLAAGDMTLYGLMLMISVSQYGRSPRQLRHSKRYDKYDVLPQIPFMGEEYAGTARLQR